VLLATGFFCSFGNSQQSKIDNDGSVPMRVAASRSSWIPTALAARYFTEIQSSNGCRGSLSLVRRLGVPVVEFV